MNLNMKANELIRRLSDAAGDIAMEKTLSTPDPYFDRDYMLWRSAAELAGTSDLAGAYADHLWSDADFQQDFFGDWAWEWSEDPKERIRLWQEIKSINASFSTACDRLITNCERRSL